MTDTLRIHHKDGVWRWTITAANNEIVEASTQPYNSREACMENIARSHTDDAWTGRLSLADLDEGDAVAFHRAALRMTLDQELREVGDDQ